jgi:hypothetical protein
MTGTPVRLAFPLKFNSEQTGGETGGKELVT